MTIWTRIKELLSAPVFEGDAVRTRRARLLNALLLSIFGASMPMAIILAVIGSQAGVREITAAVVFSLIGLIILRQGWVKVAGWVFLLGVSAAALAALWLTGGFDTGNAGVFQVDIVVAILSTGLLLGGHSGFILAALGSLAMWGMRYLELYHVTPPSADLLPARLVWLSGMYFTAAVMVRRFTRLTDNALERVRQAGRELAERNDALETSHTMLSNRTERLEQYSRYLTATAEVAREASSLLDVSTLLDRVVVLIRERFDVDHAGIYLLDETAEDLAVLQAASSRGGALLEPGLRIDVTTVRPMRVVIARGERRLIENAELEVAQQAGICLPDAQAQVMLPLRARGEITGILEVQSREPEAFREQMLEVFQTLADQVALAISNARLYQQTRMSLEAERRAYGNLSQQAWSEMLRARSDLGYRSAFRGVQPVKGDEWHPAMVEARRTGEIVQVDAEEVAVPVKIREQIVGVVRLRKLEEEPGWTEEGMTLLATLMEQLGLALENARLYQDTQRRAARERLTSEVTARMRESLDVETVLKTTVDEMYQALGLDEVVVRLVTDEKESERSR